MIDKSIQYFEEGGAAVDDWQPPAAMDQKAYDAYQKLVDQGSDPFAARALLTAVGLLPYDKRYDLRGRGTVTANDALQFQKYADGVETEYDDAIKKTYAGYRLPPPDGELMPIPPGGDFGLPPLPPGGPVQPSPPVVAPPPVYGGPVTPPPVYGGPVTPPPVYGGPVTPPPVYGGPVTPPRDGELMPIFPGGDFGLPPPVYGGPVTPPPVYGGPAQPSPPVYQPPAITTPAAGETRRRGHNATLARFANSPFARPQGVESLRLGGLEL